MAVSSQEIKNRIRSVDSTKKITRVMQLIASTELSKQRRLMQQNREYAQGLEELLAFALQSAEGQSPYLHKNEGKPAFVFVISSDMGLCGSYNANVYRTVTQEIQPDDMVAMVGSRGCIWGKSRYNLEEELDDLNQENAYTKLSVVMEKALQMFEREEISSIQVLYTHYKNTLTYITKLETLLPLEKKESTVKQKALTDYEPGQEEMLASLLPMATKSILYSRYLESKTSEQASRRMAMEAATDNANELRDELMLQFNQARQSAITNEIIDIVGGANALS